MSKVLTPTEVLLPAQNPQNPKHKQIVNGHNNKNVQATPTEKHKSVGSSTCSSARSSPVSSCVNLAGLDLDDLTATSSIMEFLRKERECDAEADAESIFQEVNRLADNSDTRTMDEILREAELLIEQQQTLAGAVKSKQAAKMLQNKSKKALTKQKSPLQQKQQHQPQNIKMNSKFTKSIENKRPTTNASSTPLRNGQAATIAFNSLLAQEKVNGCYEVNNVKTATPLPTPTPQTPNSLTPFIDNLPTESLLSEESTPKDMQNCTLTTERDMTSMPRAYDTDEGTDTVSAHLWLLILLLVGLDFLHAVYSRLTAFMNFF